MLRAHQPNIGSGAYRTSRRTGEAVHAMPDSPVYTQPGGTPTNVRGVPGQARAGAIDAGMQGPEPNLANLLGSGETTFLVDFEPSNFVTLPAGVGSTVSIVVTNNCEWPLLLKRLSLFSDTHRRWLFQVRRGDGRLIIGDGFIHANCFGGTSVPGQLGPGIQLERLADLTFTFTNLDAALATDIGIGFEALEIANPEQLAGGRTLAEQVAMLNQLHEKWIKWGGLNPQERGLGFMLHEFGRFYTFPITRGTNFVRDDTDPRFQSIDLSLSPLGTPNRGTFRNETGGVFIWQAIAFNSDTGAGQEPFTFDISAGAQAWKMTESAVDSRLYSPAGVNGLDQYTPLWLPRPWVVKDQTTIAINLATSVGLANDPGVWFTAIGILVGGNVL